LEIISALYEATSVKTVTLDLDKYLSWRSSDDEFCVRLTNSDTAVLTISENGYDAQAMCL
tara:strand:- start:716 stop:895 length:180 start_codon:yes stop_codon:yes gene_type:complete